MRRGGSRRPAAPPRRSASSSSSSVHEERRMAYGDAPVDKDLQEAWAQFCDRLKAAGDLVFKDANPATSLQRVDGFRYLIQNLSQAFDLALETKDTKYPALHVFCSPTRKLGSDNADCIYMQAW